MISASLKEGPSSERKQARVSSALPNGIRMTETSGLSLFGKRTTALEESRARRKTCWGFVNRGASSSWGSGATSSSALLPVAASPADFVPLGKPDLAHHRKERT